LTSDRHAPLRGLAAGLCLGLVLCAASWLSPLAASDRPTLALLAVTLSLPFGVVLSRRPTGVRHAGEVAAGSVLAALALAAVVAVLDPALFVRTSSWCVAAALLGTSLGSISRAMGVFAAAFWLLLCGLPFFYQHVPVLAGTFENWALQGCPWLGFSSDAFGGDPLRRPVLYLGRWSGLSDSTTTELLRPATLWLAAVPAFASLVLSSGARRETVEDSAVVERAGA